MKQNHFDFFDPKTGGLEKGGSPLESVSPSSALLPKIERGE
jgi:hypothetical protein